MKHGNDAIRKGRERRMGIRPCAMESAAFAALKEAYDHRDAAARAHRAAGGQVLGKLGCDVPDELALAAGLLPVQVYADPARPLTLTDQYLESAFEPVVRAEFEKLVDGTYGALLDFLAISNSTDVLIRVFLYLRELQRVAPETPIPPLTFLDWLFTRTPMHRQRDVFVLGLFRKQLEDWTGRALTDAAIRDGSALCNENRRALREIAALRHAPEVRIAGSEALVVIGAGLFMEKERHSALVRAVTEDARCWPALTGPRVYYTGANQEDTALYERMEAAGLVVVGEDTDWGERSFDRDVDLALPPLEGVADRCLYREFSAKKSTVRQRVEALAREVDAAGADGVVFYTHRYDEVAAWDMPQQRRMLEAKGMRHVTFGQMRWPVSRNEGLDETLAAFAAALRGGAQE